MATKLLTRNYKDFLADKVKDAIQKGAAGFVVKPLTASGVLQKIRVCMNKK